MQFACYGNSAGYRPDLAANPGATAAWVDDFLAVARSSGDGCSGHTAQTWKHCFLTIDA